MLLKKDDSKTLASQVSCGRKYNKLKTTNDKFMKQVFHNVETFVKYSVCQGSFKCLNSECPFTERFNAMNQVHF